VVADAGGPPAPTTPDSGTPTSEALGPLRINELMAKNDGAWIDEVGEADDWIELTNASDQLIQLANYSIEDAAGASVSLPDVQLQPGQLLVVFADDDVEQGPLHLPFKLGAAGDRVRVMGPDGTLSDAVEFVDLGVNETIARLPDTSGPWLRCRYASPGKANGSSCVPPPPLAVGDSVEFDDFQLPTPFPALRDTLVISELALRPSGTDPAFVELFNAGSSPVSLSDAVLNLSPHKPSQPWPTSSSGTMMSLPTGVTLDPGQSVAMEIPANALTLLEADPEFEGVITLFESDAATAIERLDFMQWPPGATLARTPEATVVAQFCTNQTPGALNTCEPLTSRDVGERVRALRTPGDYAALSAGADRLGIGTVKFVTDEGAPGLVHFLASSRWPLHYTFVRERIYLDPELDRCDPAQYEVFYDGWVQFSYDEYYNETDRRFFMGTLSDHSGAGIKALEYTFGDKINPDQMRDTYYTVVEHTLNPSEWVLRPQDEEQVTKARALEGSLPLVSPNAPFVGVTFQPLTEGVGYGTLRFIPASELGSSPLGADVIVITDDVPNDIALVGGLITEAFQTPLAHVNVLSQNRGTPNASLVDARVELRDYLDQLVRVEVSATGLDVSLADAAEAAQFWQDRRPAGSSVAPRLDTSVRGVQPLADHSLNSLPAIGAKASQMAELGRVDASLSECATTPTIRLPDSPFAIPVVHYLEHFDASGAAELLAELRADPAFAGDPTVRTQGLAAVREMITQHPVDEGLLAEIETALADRFGEQRVRFRSSSNTEDLPNFNGAGLYTSISVQLANDARRVDDGLRTVWASLWNLRAFDERAYARIDDSNVAMGVLVHPAQLSEEANGVAVSRNVLEPTRGDLYYLNAQIGEASVTNPAPGVSTEQLVYRWTRQPPILYHGTSSLLVALPSPPETVMSLEEVVEASCALRAIHRWFQPLLDPNQENRWFAMEIEFKLSDGDRELLIKQARPHSFGKVEFFADCREF
jgi:hypothetical protein